ncbi:2-oxoacid:acceptor oxidoreductase family protein [Dysosmobacter sp.]|uniref:2-oxoacid:acceptor oxidoreductase family protein n=1 Tax=Dysosmobacter sp. TaxID=2591382 RepID=UPI002A867C34|nr:2-oxoacid:acceptor oxidoreductase family protein [Dysosmobacter sp.]MDY3282118.1 2-oxoacid:acceptor oxidoreductase family protein [Dysosmobacter sp.]
MKKEIIISGFGGQGVLAIGKNLVEAGLEEGLEVTWAPSYGPEMRGGTANCHVVLSDRKIGSPLVVRPTELIAMNGPSLEKFAHLVQQGGLILINSSVVREKAEQPGVRTLYIPCGGIAEELGNPKVANMVMLGAYIGATGALHPDTVRSMIHHMFTGAKAKLVPLNLQALERGIACAG